MDGQALLAAQLVRPLRALAAAAILAALAAGCGEDEEKGGSPAQREAGPLAPLAAESVPAGARKDAARLRRSLGDPNVELEFFRSTRSKAVGAIAPDAPAVEPDGPVVVATFEGDLLYSRARTRPGESNKVRGRFAYATYSARDGSPLDLGVLPRVPQAVR